MSDCSEIEVVFFLGDFQLSLVPRECDTLRACVQSDCESRQLHCHFLWRRKTFRRLNFLRGMASA